MFAKDLLGTGVVVFLARNKPIPAGVCDALGDVAAVFSYGVGGVSIYHHGFTLWTAGAVVSMALGSLLGTILGFHLTNRVDKSGKLADERPGVSRGLSTTSLLSTALRVFEKKGPRQ